MCVWHKDIICVCDIRTLCVCDIRTLCVCMTVCDCVWQYECVCVCACVRVCAWVTSQAATCSGCQQECHSSRAACDRWLHLSNHQERSPSAHKPRPTKAFTSLKAAVTYNRPLVVLTDTLGGSPCRHGLSKSGQEPSTHWASYPMTLLNTVTKLY